MQRELALQVPLAACDLGPVQTARNFNLDALRAEAQGFLYGLAHGAAKGYALLKLRGDLFGLKLRVQLRLVYLLNGDQDFPARLGRKVALELIDLSAFAPDDDAGPRGVDDDLQPVGRTLNVYVRDAGPGEAPLEVALEPQIFQEVLAELPLGVPVRVPVLVVAESESVRMNFLTHSYSPFQSERYAIGDFR
jgi:hypothetical protein